MENPYLTELQTKVSGVNGNEITLEKTIFYAFSGGQESDTGTVGEYSVLEARKQGQEIIYILEDGHSLHQGDEVFVKIDWNRRYRLMRLHFAAEIILELACKSLKGIEKIGAHIAEDKARIDFLWGDNISKSFPVLEAAANELIAAGHEIISAFSDESNER